MTLRIITEPTVEPVSITEVMQLARIDTSNVEPAPGAVTAALASPAVAGNVDNGAHRYLATFVTASGETQAGTISSAVTVADKTVNGKVSLTAIPVGGALVTSRKIYRTAAGGSTYLFHSTIADNTTTTLLDNTADSGLGAAAPSTNTTSDPMLSLLIKAARRVAEALTGRALITQTWELVQDAFSSELKLDMMPVQSITTLKYYDSDNVLQTMSSGDYILNADTGVIVPAYGESWPSTYGIPQAVVVRFVTGYGATGASVPADIKLWIAAQVASAFRAPEGLMAGNAAVLPFVDHLLDPYRIRDFV